MFSASPVLVPFLFLFLLTRKTSFSEEGGGQVCSHHSYYLLGYKQRTAPAKNSKVPSPLLSFYNILVSTKYL